MSTGLGLPPSAHIVTLQRTEVSNNDSISPARERLQNGLSNFKHEPLRDPTAQIRLLQFAPSSSNNVIECELRIFDRADAPGYIAISYVCGGPDKKETIVTNTALHNVTSNCHYALWQASNLSQDGDAQYFWMDCICIDLENLDEKGSQVQFMWKVFADAQKVLACVGPHADDSEFVFSTSAGIHNKIPWFPARDRSQTKQNAAVATSMVYLWKVNLECRDSNAFFQRFVNALEAVFQREYWNRLWIMQEIHLAKGVGVCCGHDTISLHLLAALGCSLKARIMLSESPGAWMGPNLREAMGPFPSRYEFLRGDKAHYDFQTFRPSQCANFRDRLYGLLHIVTWPDWFNPAVIEPNYNLSKIDLLISFAGYLFAEPGTSIHCHRRLDLIRSLRITLPLEKRDIQLSRLVDTRIEVDTKAWWQCEAVTYNLTADDSSALRPAPATHEMLRISWNGSLWLFFHKRDTGLSLKNAGWLCSYDGIYEIVGVASSKETMLEEAVEAFLTDMVLAAIACDEIRRDLTLDQVER